MKATLNKTENQDDDRIEIKDNYYTLGDVIYGWPNQITSF